MANRNRVHPDEREVFLILRRAFGLPADRIASVADDELLAGLGARLHRQHHRPGVRVVTGADVRDVED